MPDTRPLTDARLRLKRQQTRERRRRFAVQLRAEGHSVNEIARMMGVWHQRVSEFLLDPRSVEELEPLRRAFQKVAQEALADPETHEKIKAEVEAEIEEGFEREFAEALHDLRRREMPPLPPLTPTSAPVPQAPRLRPAPTPPEPPQALWNAPFPRHRGVARIEPWDDSEIPSRSLFQKPAPGERTHGYGSPVRRPWPR